MSDPTSSPDIPSVIFSLGSAAGPTPWTLPDGRVIDPCGLAAALASLSARQVKALGLKTSGICGRHGFTSSASETLQSSLESRLRQRLDTNGSTECLLTWKDRATPLGRRYCQLVPLMRPTVAIAFALWPTTSARDWRSESSSAEFYQRWAANPRGKTLPMMFALALWSTCTATDSTRGVKPPRPQDTGVPLGQQLGATFNGLFAMMGKPVEFNPAFSRWEMGFHPAWDDCAPTVMPSSRKPRKPSLKATAKPEA